MRLSVLAFIAVLLPALSTTLGLAESYRVRPGSLQATVGAAPPTDAAYSYTMVSVIAGVPGSRFLVHRLLDREWNGMLFWKNRLTFVTPQANRKELADDLIEARYAEVKVNDDGVEVLIEHKTDLEGRLLSVTETMLGNKKFEPHDCARVIGECRFTVRERGKDPLYLVRRSSFEDGKWTDVERHDASRDPQKRDAVRDERLFSVDRNGVLYDMQTTGHTGKQVEVFQMRRLSPGLGGPAASTAAAIPKLPSGATATLSETCNKPSVDLSSGDKRWTLAEGEKQSLKGPSRDWKIHCGNGFTGTSCPDGGHIRAIYGPGRIIFGCYDGDIPDNPFAG